ncbi:helicase SWR1 [Pleomassaria siparia CBS 279.74]|uniref:Helicase SWR1 n=1 Tax=Pleomassaria siparia CBS 279.74 TaxID=1314801 RepID=A0A6G1KQU2_9PLEO|nr:helicase SWR1 [Pleomassaria siparia CBS 279.74]
MGPSLQKPRSGRRSTRSSRTFVANSSDMDEIIEDLPSEKPPAPIRRVLKEVAVRVTGPRKTTQPAHSKLHNIVVRPHIDNASSLGSPSENNSDDETPGTSISTTPVNSVRRGTRSTRKSGLSEAVSVSFESASSRKRSRLMIEDGEEDGEGMDLDDLDMSPDAQLARQIQKEEYAKANKRSKTDNENLITLVSDDNDELSSVPPEVPAPYTGKGKGKAKAIGPPNNRGRPARCSAKGKGNVNANAFLSDADSDDEDEFKLEDESVLSDGDLRSKNETSAASASASASGPSAAAKITPMSSNRGKRKSKTKNATEKIANARRRSRWAHIEDKWERKRAMNRERAEESHPKLLTMWDDLAKIPVLEVTKAEQPASINRKLKPFQLEGLSWMTRQEKTDYRGGLLGDEMGMGKTIQAVSLIMSDYPVKEPTLVVVPPVALMQWSNEIREYTDGKLKVLVYHGTNAACKKMTIKDLKKFDVIMVSYNSLESLHRKEMKGWTRGEDIIKASSPLHAIKYHRLILDEAHSIKSRNTGVAKACFALKGTYKWCLSGTPVQNRIGEFFSLLRFLEVRPFADYFCRSCDCEQLHWAVDEDHMCSACNHGGSEHISVFNQELLNPITGDDVELRETALSRLHMITARIMLRRMKKDYTNSMELPMKDIIIHNEFFSAVERDFSSSIMSNTVRKFDTYVAQGVMLNNYANIFGLIMQMRQVANHPDLLLKKTAVEGSSNVYVCNICDEPAEDAVRSRCHHDFCRACVKDFIETCEASGTDADCPRCHIGLSIDFEQPELEQDEEQVKKTSIINRIKMENWTSSTKIEMLVYDLYKLRSKKQTLKSIVFSQFTSMLQLIEWRLRRAGFNTVMLDGSMTPAQRQKSIEHFMTNPDVEVFLVSLKAGGVALNLTEASRVFIVDPWWNPAAEWQSADRCHRIGQRRPCVITRLCIEDSVESRMVALQEKKAAMIAGTVNNDKVAMDRLTPEDLQFLFRGT